MANTRHITIIIGLFTFLFTFTEFVYIFCFHHSSSHQRKDSSTSPAVTPPPSNKSALLTNPATLAHSREKAKRWVREQATRFLESYFKVCNFFIFVYFLTNWVANSVFLHTNSFSWNCHMNISRNYQKINSCCNFTKKKLLLKNSWNCNIELISAVILLFYWKFLFTFYCRKV